MRIVGHVCAELRVHDLEQRIGGRKKLFLKLSQFEQQLEFYEHFSRKVSYVSEFLSYQAPS